MNDLMKTNLPSKLLRKIPANQPERLKKLPPKTPRAGDVGWMVDCEIAELSKFANLRHYLPNIPSPWVLGGGGLLGEFTPFMPAKGKIYD